MLYKLYINSFASISACLERENIIEGIEVVVIRILKQLSDRFNSLRVVPMNFLSTAWKISRLLNAHL